MFVVSAANEKSTVDKRRERERKPNIREAHGSGVVTTKPNIREAHGAGVATRKPKKQKGKKSRAKNPRNELKLPSSCTDAAGGHSQSKLCEAQRRQIKKQRAQRRKRRRHMKELRRERQRKERQRRKQEKLPAVGGEVRDKFFSFEHVGNRSRHGFVLTSTSNSSVGLPEGNSLGSSSESNLKPRRRDAVDNAKITNEISDTAVNVGNSDRPNETTYVENTAASADLVGSHGKGRADTPYTNRASATEDPVNSNSRTETTYVERNATSVHPVRQPSEVPTGSSNSIAASMTEDPVQGRGPEAVTTEPTTEGAKVASGGPTTSSPGASLAGEHEDLSRLNRVDVSGPLLGSERGDLSCVVGHFLPAPAIKHADVKYIR
ncbi:hypothetical protein PR048_000234 [Dryococelus australis]|uniref:Uncharacterized protein n=1 Tax=Dryococelus australis TaxID=614101 RepID=A0ABQ9IE22_9NEOP|nr:hypothetical protein PR048_000234 [Dryococelus australis]